MLQLDGTAAASETLQAQVGLLTERDSGLFQVSLSLVFVCRFPSLISFEKLSLTDFIWVVSQTCKGIYAKKKGRVGQGGGGELDAS